MKHFLITIGIIATVILLGLGVYSLTKSSTTSSNTTASQSAPAGNVATSPQSQPSNSSIVTAAELARNNGKNGAKCWVAVSGTVYDVSNNREWVNGEHVPSNGAAKCGLDETSVISQSPHGTSVLSKLPVVGSLQ